MKESQMEAKMKNYMDIDEAAAYIKKKKATIYQLTHKKQIPHIKSGGGLLFDPEDLDKWLAGQKVQVRKY